jgi:hypothetical protein
MGYMLDPAGLGEEIAELWQDLRDAALATLPGWARDLYAFPAPPPITPDRRTEIRQTLGVFDAVFMAEPGVLEARQRLALRMRHAAAGSSGHGRVVPSPGGPGEWVPPEKRADTARPGTRG